MTPEPALPALSNCIELYLSTHEQFGTEPFTREQLDSATDDGEPDRLLELSVAYGLLRSDGTTYCVRFAPDTAVERWEGWAIDRAKFVHGAIADRSTDGRDDSAKRDVESEQLVHDGTAFVGVMVDGTDDFESVVDKVTSVIETESPNGVVLRSSGEIANQVQRFADRLCDSDVVADTALSRPLSKEYTDVVGHHKDELEFRLYLADR